MKGRHCCQWRLVGVSSCEIKGHHRLVSILQETYLFFSSSHGVGLVVVYRHPQISKTSISTKCVTWTTSQLEKEWQSRILPLCPNSPSTCGVDSGTLGRSHQEHTHISPLIRLLKSESISRVFSLCILMNSSFPSSID